MIVLVSAVDLWERYLQPEEEKVNKNMKKKELHQTAIYKLVMFLRKQVRYQNDNLRIGSMGTPEGVPRNTANTYFIHLVSTGYFIKVSKGVYRADPTFLSHSAEDICELWDTAAKEYAKDRKRKAKEKKAAQNMEGEKQEAEAKEANEQGDAVPSEANQVQEVELEYGEALEIARQFGISTMLALLIDLVTQQEQVQQAQYQEAQSMIASLEQSISEHELAAERLRAELVDARKRLLTQQIEANKRVTVRTAAERELYAKPIVPGGLQSQSGGSGGRPGASMITHGRAPVNLRTPNFAKLGLGKKK